MLCRLLHVYAITSHEHVTWSCFWRDASATAHSSSKLCMSGTESESLHSSRHSESTAASLSASASLSRRSRAAEFLLCHLGNQIASSQRVRSCYAGRGSVKASATCLFAMLTFYTLTRLLSSGLGALCTLVEISWGSTRDGRRLNFSRRQRSASSIFLKPRWGSIPNRHDRCIENPVAVN